MNIEIYLNRDNVITFGLLEDSQPVDARTATRIILKFKPSGGGAVISIDSNTVPALFDFTTTQEFSGTVTGVLKLMLGAVAGLAVGKYHMTVVVYDPSNTNGVAWARVNVQVLNDAA